MSLKQINTRAKSLRKSRPGMSWHSAQKAAAAQLRSGGAKKRTKKLATSAVSKTRHKKRRASVGSTAVGKTPKRKKAKGMFAMLGATTGTVNRATEVLRMGAGMAGGAMATHVVLRPLEHKIVQMVEDPKLNKIAAMCMPYAEMFLGAFVWVKAPWKDVRNIGLGVMGTGVHAAVKALPFHMHSPAETVQGISGSDMMQVRIPVNGTIRNTIAGLIQKEHGYTKTPTVGRSVIRNDNGPVHTQTVGGYHSMLSRTPTVGDTDDDDEVLFHRNYYGR